jgi:hypothetical protein
MGKARIMLLLAIILGIGIGTGCMVFGFGMAIFEREEVAAFLGGGSALMSASLAAFVAYLSGGFRDFDDGEP